jgi:hypothetical protein
LLGTTLAGWASHSLGNAALSRRSYLAVIEPAKVATSSRHAWWLKIGRIDRLEGAISGVSAEISQISDAPGLDGVVNIFLFLLE